MRRDRLPQLAGLIVPLAAPAALLLTLRLVPRLDLVFRSALFHVIVVSAIAALALAVAIAAAVAGSRASEHGPVWLAFGCLCVGLLMLTHGLLTPGMLGHGFNHWLGRAPYLAITLFAVGLALAGRARNTASSRLAARWPGLVLGAPILILGGLLVSTFTTPTALSGHSAIPHEESFRWVLTAFDCVVFAATAVIHWRRWRLGRDPIQYAL